MLKRAIHDLYDCFLCLLLSASLVRNASEGFLLPDRLYGAWIPVLLLSAAIVACCAVISWEDVLRRPFLAGAAVIASAALTYCIAAGIPLGETSDPERNTALWFFLVIGCSLFVWLLGRTKAGTGILAVSGVLIHCGVSVLEFPFSLPALLLFLICAGLLLALRGTERNGAVFPESAKLIGYQLLVGIAALACASILCFAVLMPLSLPTVDLHLFTEFVSPEILTHAGLIDDTAVIADDSRASDPESGSADDAANPESSDASSGRADDMPTDDGGGITRYLNHVSVQTCFLLGMLLIDLLLLLLLSRRRLCLLRTVGKTPDEHLHILYQLILREFVLLGIPAQSSDTPSEYAARITPLTAAFSGQETDWESLAERYVRLCYAGESADRECVEEFRRYYLSLPNLLLWSLRERKERSHKTDL